MAEIHKSVTIEAPVEKAFEIVDDPENFPRYVPNVSQVVDVHRSDRRLGDSFRVIYKVLGLTFDEKFTVTDYQRLNRITATFEGGMKGTFAWSFEPQGHKTKVSVDINYRLAGGAIGKAVDALLLERTNEKTIGAMLQNLQRVVTQGGTPTSS